MGSSLLLDLDTPDVTSLVKLLSQALPWPARVLEDTYRIALVQPNGTSIHTYALMLEQSGYTLWFVF